MLCHMRAGRAARNVADIGTGTGLLAFAALELWPRAYATASDIDAACVGVLEHNARKTALRSAHARRADHGGGRWHGRSRAASARTLTC
jgi:ribosomal protein L11 methyltransferase